jgi:uncharacterized protein with HEPN domain
MTTKENMLVMDIHAAILSIDDHLEGRKFFSEHENNKVKRKAVEKQFEIIGKAISKLMRINPKITERKYTILEMNEYFQRKQKA